MNRPPIHNTWFLIAGFILVLVSGCLKTSTGSVETQPDSGTTFRQRWWNYYARALNRADQQVYAGARNDLMAAISDRDGDQRMARTYGMHFVDYFPHRELGVIYWLTGDLAAAQRELESSIARYPSAKARYYLDLVRKAQIRRLGTGVRAPVLTLSVPEGVYWTRENPVHVSGRVQDPHYVAALSVAGEPLYLGASKQTWEFQHDLDLPQGRHVIPVTAMNLAGVADTQAITIHVDRQGPWVIIKEVSAVNDEIQLEGNLFDDAGIRSLSINDQPVYVEPGQRSAFRHLEPADIDTFVFQACDRLGNTTSISVDRNSLHTRKDQWPLVAALSSGSALASFFRQRDHSPPVIRLADWEDDQTVYMDQVVLCGSVHDQGKVTKLTINGEAVLPQTGAMVLFSYFLPLKEGGNRVTIMAEDAAGNRTVRQILFERKVPKVKLLSERLRLSVFAFERKGEISDASFAFQDYFIHQLAQRHRFQLVEREQLEHILQEQKISSSRLIDRPTAVRLGHLAAAQAIVAGSLVETRTGIEIIGRVIDSETSEILTVVDAFGEDKGLTGLRNLAKGLALKIHREFPLVEGLIVDKQHNMIFTDLGSKKIRAQRRIIVFREQPVRYPSTGHLLGQDLQILGKARIVQSGPQFSKAELQLPGSQYIQPRHKVITQ